MTGSAEVNVVEIDPALIAEIACKYDFDPDELRDAINEALDRHNTWVGGANVHARGHAQRIKMKTMLSKLEHTKDAWLKLNDEARSELGFFVECAAGEDVVSPRLDFLIDLLAEYLRHYNKPHGNQASLDPLRQFTSVMIELWERNKGEAFLNRTALSFDDVGDDPDNGTKHAASESMRFLVDVGQCLKIYSVTNFESAAHTLGRKSRAPLV